MSTDLVEYALFSIEWYQGIKSSIKEDEGNITRTVRSSCAELVCRSMYLKYKDTGIIYS
jgi:hypothetical protein